MVSTDDTGERNGRNRKALEALASRLGRGQMPPTARELASICGYKSSQSGYRVLSELEHEGLIERLPAPKHQRRPVRITERGWHAVGEASVMGSIAAGRGLEAVAAEEAFSLAAELLYPVSGRQRYLLRVVGESMTGANIHDGDLLVVEDSEDPPEGAIVVALLESEEVTVKRLYRENGYVRLRPDNPDYEEIVVASGAVQVQGKVVWVLHRSE
jgi:repressor LexA